MALDDTRKLLAASALASGATYEAASQISGASSRTIKRWAAGDSDFRIEHDRVVSVIRSQARQIPDLLVSEAISSIAALSGLRDDQAVSPAVRVRAAATLLDKAIAVGLLRPEAMPPPTDIEVVFGD
jgi:hypothetical protein